MPRSAIEVVAPGREILVVVTGMMVAISAVRAFIMAILVICAVMLDRFAISLGNVALAAIIILLVNPVALFTAGF